MSKRLLLAILFALPFFLMQVSAQEKLKGNFSNNKPDPKQAENELKLRHELEESLLPHNSNGPTDYYRSTEVFGDMWDGAEWDLYNRNTYTYDEDGNTTESTTEEWTGTEWENSSRVTYGYDNGYPTTYTYQNWDGTQWLNYYRYSYVYDSWGYTSHYTIQIGDSLSWVNYYRYIYWRDDDTHKQDSVLYQNWNVSSFENTELIKYLYNTEGRDSIRTKYVWSGTEWDFYSRTIYTYDDNSSSYSYIEYTWTGTDWENNSMYTYNYDNNGLYLGYLYQTWDGVIWVNDTRSSYIYNTEGRTTQSTNEEWDGGAWVGDYRYEYEYTENGNYDKYTYLDYVAGNWVNQTLYDYTYDSNNQQTEVLYQNWDGTIWVNNYRYRYFYELVAGVEDEIIAGDFHLYNNYPNPFNPTTKIEFSIPQKSNVVMKIYNILGKEVATLINGEKKSGIHSINFNASNLSSGVYFYKIEANSLEGTNSFSETKKMLLLK